jgi:hypothetical protein
MIVKPIAVSLPKDLIRDIDNMRGLIPHSLYIAKVLERNLNQKVVEGNGLEEMEHTEP